jgi:hypothetical protein
MLRDPKGFKKTMLTQKHNLETEFIYGRPPTPPLRAESAAEAPEMAAPPPPSPAPAPVADDEDDSREVTETLARLADLRDQGAITAEEYEAKKDELLGRL